MSRRNGDRREKRRMPPGPMNNEKKIVIFTFVAHFLFHFYEIAFPVLAIPLMQSLKIDLKEALALGFPMYLAFGVFSLPWGYFADRFSNRKALIICYYGGALGALLTSFSSSPGAIAGSLTLLGFFACICHPAGMGLISHGVRNRGMALGINSIAGSIGLTIGPFVTGLLNWLSDWQTVYLVLAVFSFLWGTAMLMTPIDETPIEDGNIDHDISLQSSAGYVRNLLLFALLVTLGGLAYRINIVVLPAYFEFNATFLNSLIGAAALPDISARHTMAAAILVSLVYVVGIIGQLTGGRLADRHDLRKLYLIFNALCVPFAVFMGLLVEQPLVAAASLYVFFALGIQPIENSLIAKFTPQKWRSTGYGVAAIMIFGVGALAVYLVGWIKDQWTLGTAYWFSAGFALVVVLGILLLTGRTRGVSFRNRR